MVVNSTLLYLVKIRLGLVSNPCAHFLKYINIANAIYERIASKSKLLLSESGMGMNRVREITSNHKFGNFPLCKFGLMRINESLCRIALPRHQFVTSASALTCCFRDRFNHILSSTRLIKLENYTKSVVYLQLNVFLRTALKR